MNGTERSRQIVRVSLLGIGANLGLAGTKAAIGLLSASIAILLDAVNNLSDAISSLITIIGTRLAAKRPDRKHPFGHGRIEYLTAGVIGLIILAAGVLACKESVEKILHPQRAAYSVLRLGIVGAAVLVKLAMGVYVRRKGRQLNAQALTASGTDAFFDAVLSFATLIGGVLSLCFGLAIEGWLGVLISLAILRAGIQILAESFSSLIGVRADPALTGRLRARIAAFPEVRGVYDLTLHSYGPMQTVGSVQIEVREDMTAKELHRLSREICAAVEEDFGIALTVGVYASNEDSPYLAEIRKTVETLAAAEPEVLQLHGFYGDEARRLVMFDLVVDFAADREALRKRLLTKLRAAYPKERFDVLFDTALSDLE